MHKASTYALVAISALLMATTAQAAVGDQPRIAAGSPRIVCGITGCFEVKPGCYAEMRPSGRGGVVAVVICNRK